MGGNVTQWIQSQSSYYHYTAQITHTLVLGIIDILECLDFINTISEVIIEIPFVVPCDGLSMVGHKHVVRPFEGSEDQSVDRMLLDILYERT